MIRENSRATRFASAVLVLLGAICARPAAGQGTIADELRTKVDAAVTDVLTRTGAPSASIALVADGRIVYTHAYGLANLESKTPATPDMRYSIGSVSKQFTASAILLLAEEGKLSLDDRVARWLPDLTRAGEVTIRQILSMTSGYQDYWPQDYVMPPMLKPVTAQAILDEWARKPLDFEPGSRWQYSNTNYVIAGLIVEKASGMPLLEFLSKRDLRAIGDEDRERHRQRAARVERSGAIPSVCARPAAIGAQGRQRLAVRRRRTGDDG